MNPTKTLIEQLRLKAEKNEIIVLTVDEAFAVYQYIDDLHNRIETKQLKFMAICEQTYEMVKLNRELKKRLENLGQLPEDNHVFDNR